ncbi:RluA family pseudouridine synthase [Portibacter lacus]|uniref:RNA pseudouridine synthase n=1 Tax=Portibacter lacus TaxID=1099794 RepID=A0AA37SNU7_9BACT|nr:RluA family pseudouridine synthase [Portibacter lacus]GLR18203.1 RNA pseudouridine synthase [Portibacter lacus]
MTNKEIQDCIIYQDASFLIANKPAGISAQDDLSDGESFHKLLEAFSTKKLFVVHRLDRPTSGVMVFAKKNKAAAHFSKLMAQKGSEKKYLAAVKNAPKEPEGELTNYLYHDTKLKKCFISKEANKQAKIGTLTYKTLTKIENYTLLEVSLESGRFHQIRAQLSSIGSPIKGDVKYGARRGNKDRSINLHSYKLSFHLLYDNELIKLQAAIPNEPVWEAFKEILPEIGENKYEKWKQEQT